MWKNAAYVVGVKYAESGEQQATAYVINNVLSNEKAWHDAPHAGIYSILKFELLNNDTSCSAVRVYQMTLGEKADFDLQRIDSLIIHKSKDGRTNTNTKTKTNTKIKTKTKTKTNTNTNTNTNTKIKTKTKTKTRNGLIKTKHGLTDAGDGSRPATLNTKPDARRLQNEQRARQFEVGDFIKGHGSITAIKETVQGAVRYRKGTPLEGNFFSTPSKEDGISFEVKKEDGFVQDYYMSETASWRKLDLERDAEELFNMIDDDGDDDDDDDDRNDDDSRDRNDDDSRDRNDDDRRDRNDSGNEYKDMLAYYLGGIGNDDDAQTPESGIANDDNAQTPESSIANGDNAQTPEIVNKKIQKLQKQLTELEEVSNDQTANTNTIRHARNRVQRLKKKIHELENSTLRA